MHPPRHTVLMIEGPRRVRFQDLPLPAPGPSDVVVRPLLSAFKHGTEMMAYSGNSPFAKRAFNHDLRLFEDRPEAESFYPRAMGSMVVGEVEWAGSAVRGLVAGQRVFAWAPIADRHVLPADKALPLGELTPEQAVCIDPASFALGAVLDGAIGSGDRVLVTGLGAIGLFAVQYCRALGAEVFAASHFASRRTLAESFGAEAHDPAASGDLGTALKQQMGGVDAAIECSGSLGTLQSAIRSARQCGRVVCVGFYGPGDSRLNLGEEFFHNRISLLASLPAFSWNNPVRGDLPLHAADLQRRVIDDFGSGTIQAQGIVGPVLPFRDALRAVELIADEPQSVVKLALAHEGTVAIGKAER